jgi:outer membrane protein TolC
MTQLKVGVSQMFPRGDTRALKQQQLKHIGGQFPYQRQARQLRVAETVSRLWFDAYEANQSIALVERDRALFEQLVDVALASYSSAMGKTRQQDIIRAQLELIRLDDRLTTLLQDYEANQQRLSQWLSNNSSGQYSSAQLPYANWTSPITDRMPVIGLIHPTLYKQDNEITLTVLAEYFHGHPDIQAIEQKIKASTTSIEVQTQKYKPEWGINTSYAYRDDDGLGRSRADFFSIGLTLDIPLFTENRQDKQVESAIATTEAIKTEKVLRLRQLMASFTTAKVQLDRLDQRQDLYQTQLLPQMSAQAEASLTAYTNDDGDFAEVVRARIAQLNAKIDALGIDVERQKTIIALNALFATNSQQIVSSSHKGKTK